MINIKVEPQQIIHKISPYLTGACIEDVNHEIYGGLYSQMIFGEAFEEEPMEIIPERNPAFAGLSGTVSCLAEREYLADRSEIRSWQPFRKGSAQGRLKATQMRSRRGCRSQQIEFLEGRGEVGIENRGLNRWGMNFVPDRVYEGLLVVAGSLPGKGPDEVLPVYVALESADGATVYAEATLSLPADQQWHTLPFTLIPSSADTAGRFAITLRCPGSVWVDYALLQPGDWGRFRSSAARRDIGEALAAQGLTVLRLGGYMTNTDWASEQQAPGSGYRWKKMIGPRQDRPPYRGTFYRFASNGFGIVDFLRFCQAAGILAVPVLNPHETPADLQDFLEYVNGSADTPWGARRAVDGFPEPFGVRFVEIGNEESINGLVNLGYVSRIRETLEAMREKDPSVTPILGAGLWADRGSRMQEKINRKAIAATVEAVHGFIVLWDVHVNADALDDAPFAERDLTYVRGLIDEIDPQNHIGLCVLEENGFRHDIQRALGHAHNILTFERLGLVSLDCAANCLQPWQQHDNYWDQGQVFFTPSQVWGMPPFYAQQMLARAYQPCLVQATVDGDEQKPIVVATRSADGKTLVVKVLNLAPAELSASITLPAGELADGQATVTCLHGSLTERNSPEEPEKIVPVETVVPWDGQSFEHTFPGYSFTVIQLQATSSV